ncbi:restriction endonuclease subunit S [Bacteroides cellulosilyticus]|jgi:type I restriction enzyme S subunit|uniref:restriction endonuclease subunit S n=1 Tax=Bacteroides cellulosilyticus TaxID=246787 RepID=UPI0032EF5137
MANTNNNKSLNVPNLRFPEFTGEWKAERLNDIAILTKGAGISKDQLSESGEPCILYGELYTKYKSEIIEDVISKTNIPTDKLIKSKANDVLIPCSGETAVDIATARCVLSDNVLLGGDLNIIRLKHHDGSFMSYQLNGKRKYDIAKVAQGVSVVHLYGENLKGIVTYNPQIEEQKKIVGLLSLLDERIATQNKIIGDLKKLKSAIVDKLMTPQKEWKSTKIGNVLSIGSGRDYKHLEDGNIPVYGTGGYMLSVDSYLYDGESVCIGRKGTINKPIFLKGKFWTVDTLFYTHTFRSITPRFCYYLFTTIDWLKYNEASGVPSLSKVAIENISISIPDLVTQKQICAVLDSMTDKLDIEQKSLDAYRAQKQYLLQQMFI